MVIISSARVVRGVMLFFSVFFLLIFGVQRSRFRIAAVRSNWPLYVLVFLLVGILFVYILNFALYNCQLSFIGGGLSANGLKI